MELIDVSPYLKKLEQARDMIFMKIDAAFEVRQTIRIFEETGMLPYRGIIWSCFTPEIDAALTEAKNILNNPLL